MKATGLLMLLSLVAVAELAILHPPLHFTEPPAGQVKLSGRILKEKKHKAKKTQKARGLAGKKSMAELKKYAVSSMVGIISAKVAAADPGLSADNQQALLQRNIEQMFSSPDLDRAVKAETKIFVKYLKSHNIDIPKDIKLKDMKRIVKQYSQEQYAVDPLTFDTVEPIATKVYKTIRKSDVVKV